MYPLLIQGFLGEAHQASLLGKLRLWSLMAAVLMQSFWGILSDRSTHPWGRRKPFILWGTLADLAIILGIALLVTTDGMTGYVLLFILAILLSVSVNAAIAAVQCLIPDRIPENLHGRFSGVKAVLEIPLPAILVVFTIGTVVKNGNIPAGLVYAMWVLILCTGITLLVPDKRQEQAASQVDWTPFFRLFAMTAFFTILILGIGKLVAWSGSLIASLQPAWLNMVWMGFFGLLGMLVAIVFGVWICIRISLGAEARRNRSFTWWIISRLAFLVGFINLSTFTVFYFQKRLGYASLSAAGPAARLVQIVAVVIFLSALPSGWMADRFGFKKLLVLSGLVATAGTVMVLISTNLSLIYTGGAMIGLSAGLFYPANWALGTNLVPRDQAARFLGLSNLAGAGAGAIGAYIGGSIADTVSASVTTIPGAGYLLLFAIYACIFLLSSAAILPVRHT